jgi:internalin A
VSRAGVPPKFDGLVSRDGRRARLSTQGLTSVPEWLRDFTALTYLNLSANSLTSVPEWLGNLATLTTLDLRGNNLASLPESLGNLTALSSLGLGSNKLTSVPEWVANLTALTTLGLGRNGLVSVPEWVGNLRTLTALDLSFNELTLVPESLGNLTALTDLDLSFNELTLVPESLGNLTALTLLSLTRNQLTTLPVHLADLLDRGLQLRIERNPLDEVLIDVRARGTAELATYLRSLRDGEPQYEAKLLVVGEGNVGKTSLLAALRSAPFVEGRETTHGIEITPLTIPHPTGGKEMTVRGWDFGGQEVYRISHQFFFTQRALYVVAWNARQGREQDEVEGWLRRIRLRVGDARVLLAATHCEERQPELDYPHLERTFPGMLAGAADTDSRTGLGVDQLRRAIGVEAARLPQMGQRWSSRWVAAREEILAMGKTKPQIFYAELTAICERHDLDESEASTLAKLMHDLGLIIYYSDDEGLRDIVVLNPEWLTKAISYVLEDEETRLAGGILDHGQLRRIWHDRADGYESGHHRYFLRLMEKFDISYRIKDEEHRSLVAQLVPLQRPPIPWQLDDAPPAGIRTLTLLCKMTEPAVGLIPWLTVRHHHDSTGSYWRRGIFLRYQIAAYNSEALIELRGATELAVQVRAPSPEMYFNVLRDSIERLIRDRWPGLKYRLYIPCTGTAADGSPCSGTFPLDGLLRQREASRTTAPCMNCPEAPEISVLINGFATPSVSMAEQLRQVGNRLDNLTGSITAVQSQAAQIADTVRSVHKIVGTEVTDCPRLFTLAPAPATGFKRAFLYQKHYRLTLWCEHPGHEHPWEPATYDLNPPKGWFAKAAPYIVLVFKTLQIVVPVAADIVIAALPTAQERSSAQARLALMKDIVTDLPTREETQAEDILAESRRQLTPGESVALRAIRAIVFERDPTKAFGGLRRVQAPAGDLLWVCKDHYPHYDPGLPELPSSAGSA